MLVPFRSSLLAGLLGLTVLATTACRAQREEPRPSAIAQRYAALCASCHGPQLQGGSAPSMLDDTWSAGGDDASLQRSIREGMPAKGMPGFASALSEEEIRAMAGYIREQHQRAKTGRGPAAKSTGGKVVRSQLASFRLETWVDDLDEPWSLAFLPEGRALATEKGGKLFAIENGRRAEKPVSGVPAVDSGGQAGLFDVVPHPRFAETGWIYLAYAEPRRGDGARGSLTRIIRGRVRDNAWVDQENVWQADARFYTGSGGVHYGGRIAFDRDGFLFFTIGERGTKENAQNLGVPMGKVHRLHDDGRIPADNPFVSDAKAQHSIWSYGHRNPQGLAFDPANGQLFDLEHGPRGGDELNLVVKAKNYGWPVITYGINYNGTKITDLTAKEGMEQPVVYWVPSLAVCGMNFYTGDLFPQWKGQLFISSLAAEELRRLEVRDGKVRSQETILKDEGRIRHVIGGPDGALYVLLPKRIARLSPE